MGRLLRFCRSVENDCEDRCSGVVDRCVLCVATTIVTRGWYYYTIGAIHYRFVQKLNLWVRARQ